MTGGLTGLLTGGLTGLLTGGLTGLLAGGLTATHLLEAGLHQVLGEEVPDEVEEGVHAGDVVVLLAVAEVGLQLGVPRVDDDDQDHPQDGGDHRGGHVVYHGPRAQTPAGLGVQTGQACVGVMEDARSVNL